MHLLDEETLRNQLVTERNINKQLKHELKQFEWISVEDRLPEENIFYLTLWSDGVIETYEFSHYTGLQDIKSGCFNPVHNTFVTHWMSLPQPPKEK